MGRSLQLNSQRAASEAAGCHWVHSTSYFIKFSGGADSWSWDQQLTKQSLWVTDLFVSVFLVDYCFWEWSVKLQRIWLQSDLKYSGILCNCVIISVVSVTWRHSSSTRGICHFGSVAAQLAAIVLEERGPSAWKSIRTLSLFSLLGPRFSLQSAQLFVIVVDRISSSSLNGGLRTECMILDDDDDDDGVVLVASSVLRCPAAVEAEHLLDNLTVCSNTTICQSHPINTVIDEAWKREMNVNFMIIYTDANRRLWNNDGKETKTAAD